ncbi:MAG: recombination-associated protein RdgC [Castellaniella sp.]
MWFKNLRVFRLAPEWSILPDALEQALAGQAFQPCASQDAESLGWVAPRSDDPLVHAVGKQYLLCLRAERRLLPASVVRQAADQRADELEEQQGYRPGRRQMRELREEMTQTLLPQAFRIHQDTRIWLDLEHHWLVIDAAAAARADAVMGLLADALQPLPAQPLELARSPAAAMTAWLLEDNPPDGFTIDQEAELRAADDSKATVRYVRHDLDAEELGRHIATGKQCTRLALTWADRISFVLTDAMELRRISPLDILDEGSEASDTANEDERFDADFSLMSAELAVLLDALVAALNETGGK